MRFINRQKANYSKFPSDSSEFGNEVFDDTGFGGESMKNKTGILFEEFYQE